MANDDNYYDTVLSINARPAYRSATEAAAAQAINVAAAVNAAAAAAQAARAAAANGAATEAIAAMAQASSRDAWRNSGGDEDSYVSFEPGIMERATAFLSPLTQVADIDVVERAKEGLRAVGPAALGAAFGVSATTLLIGGGLLLLLFLKR